MFHSLHPAVKIRSAIEQRVTRRAAKGAGAAQPDVRERCSCNALDSFPSPGRVCPPDGGRCETHPSTSPDDPCISSVIGSDERSPAMARKIFDAQTRLMRLVPLLKQDTPRRTPRLLDIGCATGATLAAAKAMGWKAQGVDTNHSAIQQCTRNDFRACHFDGRRLPFRDSHFDLITSWRTIEHAEDAQETLAEWFRVLKPGGLLILETPHARCWKARLLQTRCGRFLRRVHRYTFTPETLSPLLTCSGFEPLPLPLMVWPEGMSPRDSVHAVAHQMSVAAWRITRFSKSFQVLARRPWCSVHCEPRSPDSKCA